ncbi:AcrR family transcriptional regulator [Mycetocola sp. BIGb0189]|uniref:TetR/AcrR family transcriptional regulator n=1 Tax=Mycetocola sp. BIGb0189 TaxID=2940604 RepID=UPI0021689C3A|nr:TetR family transcriptional regulator [Mycetocola sp. BIGb0189]MCS4275394.1 AcrR family transcriptional regulator [Mycetocola sp. BIGb0189]
MAWDTERTQKLLLDAATACFSESGLAGTRIDAIARAAGVNKERIYSYFGNKEALFETVLSRELETFVGQVHVSGVGAEAVGEYAGAFFDRFHQSPHLPRLLAWEGLERPAARMGGHTRLANCVAKVDTLSVALPGVSRPQVAQLLLSIIMLAAAWWTMPQMNRLVLGGSEGTQDDPETAADRFGRDRHRRAELVVQVTGAARALLASD